MTRATEQDAALVGQFARRRRRQAAAIVAIAAVFAAYSLLPLVHEEARRVVAGPVGFLVLLVVVGVTLFTIRNWRCPGCGAFLGMRVSPKSCTECGRDLIGRQ